MPEASEERSAAERRWQRLSLGRKLRYLTEFVVASPFLAFVYALPEVVALGLARGVGRLAYYALRGRRRIGLANLAIAFPDLPDRERRRILIRSLENLAQTAAEFVRLPRLSNEQIRERVTYPEGSRERITADQGHLLLTGHFGNWELIAIAYGLSTAPIYIVGRPIANPIFDGMVTRRRSKGGNILLQTGETESAGHSVTEELKRGRVIGILVDQYPSRRKGIQVPFFGKPAWCHRGPAILAMRSGVPCVPGFARRDPNRRGHYQLDFRPPIFVDSSLRPRERLRVLTEQFQKVVEDEIRRHPEEWLWTHRRWKRTPEGDDLYGDSGSSRRGRRRKRRPPGKGAKEASKNLKGVLSVLL